MTDQVELIEKKEPKKVESKIDLPEPEIKTVEPAPVELPAQEAVDVTPVKPIDLPAQEADKIPEGFEEVKLTMKGQSTIEPALKGVPDAFDYGRAKYVEKDGSGAIRFKKDLKDMTWADKLAAASEYEAAQKNTSVVNPALKLRDILKTKRGVNPAVDAAKEQYGEGWKAGLQKVGDIGEAFARGYTGGQWATAKEKREASAAQEAAAQRQQAQFEAALGESKAAREAATEQRKSEFAATMAAGALDRKQQKAIADASLAEAKASREANKSFEETQADAQRKLQEQLASAQSYTQIYVAVYSAFMQNLSTQLAYGKLTPESYTKNASDPGALAEVKAQAEAIASGIKEASKAPALAAQVGAQAAGVAAPTVPQVPAPAPAAPVGKPVPTDPKVLKDMGITPMGGQYWKGLPRAEGSFVVVWDPIKGEFVKK